MFLLNRPSQLTVKHSLSGNATLTIRLLLYTKTKSKNSTDTCTNRINIQFTKEIQENGRIPSLDRPTLTYRLLDQTSYNPPSHKVTTKRTLTRKAQIVCDSDNSLTDEIKHLNTVFIKNNYNTDFIERNIYIRPNDSSTNSYTNTATISYIRGTSETIARTLQP